MRVYNKVHHDGIALLNLRGLEGGRTKARADLRQLNSYERDIPPHVADLGDVSAVIIFVEAELRQVRRISTTNSHAVVHKEGEL